MDKLTILIVLITITCVFALQKPTNYYAGKSAAGGVRGNQQQTSNFAVWNTSSNNWMNVIPPNLGSGNLYGVVAVGTGLLAYGSFQSIGSHTAAALAYYDGNVWTAPEGIGLYTLNYNSSYSFFDNVPTGVGTAYAATVVGNTVYLLGNFDQVGTVRTGVNGFVSLTWSAGGVFTINQIGNGYFKNYNPSVTCAFCPYTTQPPLGTKNKLLTFSFNSNQYFILQDNLIGDIWVWQVNSAAWVKTTAGNNARNLTTQIKDFDVVVDSTAATIFVVGAFQIYTDPNPQNLYTYIAQSSDYGTSWQQYGPVLNQTNFGNVPAVLNSQGVTICPALTGSGFTAIAAQNRNSIFVAGGYRVSSRLTNGTYGVPNELQTRIIQLTSASSPSPSPLSDRFGPYPSGTANYNIQGPNVDKLALIGGNLYAFGNFQYYKQVAFPQYRFGNRYVNALKGAIVYTLSTSQQWQPAFGGFLTTSGDTSPLFSSSGLFLSSGSDANGNTIIFFAANPTTAAAAFTSTYGLLSGGVFAYGGDPVNNANNKWNVVYSNNRIITLATAAFSGSYFTPQSYGADGSVNCLVVTQAGDALLIGGQFDYIGNNLVPGVAFYNPDIGLIGSIGGGLFQYNNNPYYYADNQYNNRIGGVVNDITEYNGYLYAGGLFNRNNTGYPLANIAAISFRTGGAGWIQVDGGCDGQIRDMLINGGKLYVTGSFFFCGLNSEGFIQNDGLYHGRVPTSKIAVIDLTLNPSLQSWRPLGIGLQGGDGLALTWNRGQLYVGGAFSSAGGALNTAYCKMGWH